MTRVDVEGYSTKVTALGSGYGLRILKKGKVVVQGHAPTKADIASVLKEMLRMLDKCGNPSSMASASRARRKK